MGIGGGAMNSFRFMEVYGLLNEALWVLVLLFITYLLFLLHRRHVSLVSRIALLAALGWGLLTFVGTAAMMYDNVAYRMNLPSLPFVPWDSLLWQLMFGLIGVCFVMAAGCFLGLAITQRRSKSRVARGGKT